jgi:hypothetical protein
MANWKKVVVSGSAAHLLNVTASNLTNDNLVIAGTGGALESSGLTYNGTTLNLGTAQVVAGGFTGSFTGSFTGDGSQLTGVVATSANSLTNATGGGIVPFSYNGLTAQTVAVSGAVDLTDNAITKWNNTDNKFQNSSLTDNGTAITGTTSIQLTGANSNLSGSFSGSFFGNGSGLTGLASTLTVDGDAGTEDVNLITDDLQVIGTANEVETAVTKVGTDVKVTIGLPSNVTIGNNLTVSNNLTVFGTQSVTTDFSVLTASATHAESTRRYWRSILWRAVGLALIRAHGHCCLCSIASVLSVSGVRDLPIGGRRPAFANRHCLRNWYPVPLQN